MPVDTGATPPASRPRTPRWVKVFAIIGALVALLVVLMLTGALGKGHGPGRHLRGMSGMHRGAGSIGGLVEAAAATRSVEAGMRGRITIS